MQPFHSRNHCCYRYYFQAVIGNFEFYSNVAHRQKNGGIRPYLPEGDNYNRRQGKKR
jgi:hypothetical protein